MARLNIIKADITAVSTVSILGSSEENNSQEVELLHQIIHHLHVHNMPKLRQSELVAASDADINADDDVNDPQCIDTYVSPSATLTSDNTDKDEELPSPTSTSVSRSDSNDGPDEDGSAKICSEIDSEEEEESEDSDYDDDESESEYSDYDDDDDDDDESDDEWTCDCPNCVYRRLYGLGMEHDDDDDEEFGSDYCGSREFEAHDDESDFEDYEYQGTCCAVCFERPTSFNPLVELPCCGSNGREARSSTRFCQKCLYKTLMTNQPSNMYLDNETWRHVGECPRCRQLITMARQDKEARIASFDQAIRHAHYKEKIMMDILITVAFANPRFLPIELLANEVDKVHQMCSWGILKEERKGMYSIDPFNQGVLRGYVDRNIIDEESMPGRCQVAGDMLFAGLLTALKLKLITSGRLLNQSGISILIHFFNFPALEHPHQEFIMVFLNLFLVAMLLQVALFVIVYGLICYCAIKAMAKFIVFQKYFWDQCKVHGSHVMPFLEFAISGIVIGLLVGGLLIKFNS